MYIVSSTIVSKLAAVVARHFYILIWKGKGSKLDSENFQDKIICCIVFLVNNIFLNLDW